MTRRFLHAALAVIVPAFLLGSPASAGQNRGGSSSSGSSSQGSGGGSQGGGGGASGGHAAGGGSAGSSSGGGGQHGATGSGGGAVSRGAHQSGGLPTGRTATGNSGAAHDSGASTATARQGGAARSPRTQDGTPSGTPQYSRPRDGRPPTGTAVPRGTVPTTGSGIFVPAGYYGGLYPFGYGYYDPYGYYGGYYGGYYDPWYGGYPSSVQTTSYATPAEQGALRLKVKPKEAEVYADGYYVGTVDEFNGVFQKLELETGLHRIEIRAPGYEPLTFDVRITAGHKSTYEGELKKLP